MTSSSNESGSANAADQSATASTPTSDSGDSAQVTSTGGMAAGSEGDGADVGSVPDSQLPEELRPDAEGMAEGDGPGERTLAEGATEQTGQLPDPANSSPGDEAAVSEPSA